VDAHDFDGDDSRLAAAQELGSWSRAEGWSPSLLKAQVYDQMLLDLILGDLEPGSRLDEQVLAKRYEAGLAGVREALGRLSLEGLVIRRARAGTTVAPLDPFEARQTLEVRRLIEPHAAALAAEHATPEEVEDLGRVFDGAEAIIRKGDRRAMVLMDQDFHAKLARASGNPTLARLLAPLQHKAARFWATSLPTEGAGCDLEEVDGHRAIVVRIALRDPQGARQAVLRVLTGARFEKSRLLAKAAATDSVAQAFIPA
jgi:DNA-binding GntR family transcriptional regulator